jgi:hypothetical protein
MRRRQILLSTAALLGMLAPIAGPGPAAAKEVTIEACVVERKPTSALMELYGDPVLFELDLRPIPGTPFALSPDDCVTVTGQDRDNERGLRREFPQAGWVVEATDISNAASHLNRSSHSSNTHDD